MRPSDECSDQCSESSYASSMDGSPGSGWDFITEKDTGVLRHHVTGHAVALYEGSNGWLLLKQGDKGPELNEWSAGNTDPEAWGDEERRLHGMLMTSPGAHPLGKWLTSTTTFGPWEFTIADGGLVLLHNDETPQYTRFLAPHGYERVSATPADEDQDENSEVHSDYGLDAGEEPSMTTALEQGLLCRITAVPEKELSSGIVAGDTVKILSINLGEYEIRREMPGKADTTAYCSAGLLVPLDKTASKPAAGSRPRVGQIVRVVGGEHRMGETGTLITDDGSSMPFQVKFPNSDTSWFVAENVALASPPENVEGELQQRPSRRSSFSAGEDESVDSDYDNDEDAFYDLGNEVLSGRLKLAKVYGQEEPPAAEDELEWETRYFVLYETRKMCHFDGMQNGKPVGDRGLIDLDTIQLVEKVLGVPTFVMKGYKKVYLFKLEPHDEVMMRTWIGAISVELSASPASELSDPTPHHDRGAVFRPSLRSASLRSLLGGGQKATQPPKAALGAPATASKAGVLALAKLMLRQSSVSVTSLFGGGEKLPPAGVPTSMSLCGELEHKTECLGTYMLEPQRTAHGKPVWKHATEDYWIAFASYGKWMVQRDADVGTDATSLMLLQDATAGLPHQSTAVWEEFDGTAKQWVKAPSCKCFGDVPTSMSLCGELEHMATCQGTYLLAPQRTANGKPVWKHATGDRWITGQDGRWIVQFCEEHVSVNNNIAFMQLQETAAFLPHQSTAVWEEYYGKQWLKAPTCKCFGDVPTSMSLCGELKHKTECLGTYLLAPQRTAQGKPVWKHATKDRWIAWASVGKWMVQEGVEVWALTMQTS